MSPAADTPAVPAPPPEFDGVDAENPWPGLASFTEKDAGFFFGRQDEAEELLRLVRRERLTVLHGQSGLGKTSLLRAGLFPRLRQQDFLPVPIRIDYSPGTPPPGEQVKLALTAASREGGVDAPPPRPEESLWEYLHRKDADFWSPRNRLLTPVLVFDQFEELFTLGRAGEESRRRGEEFVAELAALIENQPPPALSRRLEGGDAGTPESLGLDPEKRPGRIMLTLRSDFLADLESLRPLAHGLTRNRMRLRRMTGPQAMQVVLGPAAAGGLVADDVAGHIVRFVAGAAPTTPVAPAGAAADGDGGTRSADHPAVSADLEVEPALLSVVCRELNAKRRRQGLARVTADLLAGSRREILADFYERCVGDLPPQARQFVEEKLLTRAGFRNNVALDDVADASLTRDLIDRLVGRRLLRIEDRLGAQRLELTHDVLTGPVRASRDARRQREAVAAAEERARLLAAESRRRRRVLVFVSAAALGVIGALSGLSLLAVRQRNEAMRLRDRADRDLDLARLSQREAEEQKRIAEDQKRIAEAQRRAAVEGRGMALAMKAEADKSAAVARGQRKLAVDTLHSLVFDVQEKLDRPGMLPIRQSILQIALDGLNRIERGAGDTADADREAAAAQNKIGDIFLLVGRTEDASEAYQKALKIFDSLARADPGSAQAKRDLSVSYNKLGDVSLQLGDAAAARRYYEKGREIAEALARADPENFEAQTDLVFSHFKIGKAALAEKKPDEAVAAYRRALAVLDVLDRAGKLKDQPEFQGWAGSLQQEIAAAAQPTATQPGRAKAP